MSKTGRERQAALAARRRAAGLVQVAVWIPADRKADLAALVRCLVEGTAVDDTPADPSVPVTTDDNPVAPPAPPEIKAAAVAPPTKANRLRKKINQAVNRKLISIRTIASTADVPESSMRHWLKGRSLAAEHLPKVAAAINSLLGA